MTASKTFAIFLALSWFGLNSALAQDEFDPLGESELPKNIRVQVEFIEVPEETMTELLYGPKKSGNDTELRDKLQELIKAKKATMLDSQMVTARSGRKSTSESIHEFIYPTEYAPPVVSPKKDENEKTGIFLFNPATPTAFETRNVGSTLEIEPSIGENEELVELRISPEIIYHTGNEVWTEVTKGEDKHRIGMPNFYTLRIQTGIAVIAGQYSLAAALSPKDDKGEADFSRKVLIFVKADVLTIGR